MAAVAPSSSVGGFGFSNGPSSSSMTAAGHRRRSLPSPGGRSRGQRAESLGGQSEDEGGDGFADDEVPTSRVRVPANIPKVTDKIGDFAQQQFMTFMEEFEETPSSSGGPPSSAITNKYYIALIHGLKTYGLSTVYLDYQHLSSWNSEIAAAIQLNYYRFLPFLNAALHSLIAKYEPQYFREHRQPTASSQLMGSSASEGDAGMKTANQQTDKVFAIAFYNLPLVTRVRSLRAMSVGQLLSISGTVTRTSEVRPELSTATFVCEACRAVVANVEQTFRYTEPSQCPNLTCQNRQAWKLDIRQSTFVDWQKVRIQENSSEIPTGSMPRTMDVILRGEIVERAKAGEKCIFTGALIVVPDVSQLGLPGTHVQASRDDRNAPRGGDSAGGTGVSGLKALGVRDLTYRLAFLACMVLPDTTSLGGGVADIISSLAGDEAQDASQAQEAVLASYGQAEIDDLRRMVHSDHIYSRLVNSLAPMVYGHEVVKKGLLLQLMSGVHKTTAEGMQLRGDINICIVGDPSTSKSQFLKYVCSFAPRAVYTSGKASSAAGLTAAVVKDEETGEFTIEAGALMLADNGVCAIDEFDKMDIADQVAIHEAMEQQTISIAKAGIQATLNARTSILAAANPVGGRYNRKTTLRANINMSAPIMSRFDLFFVVLDECNEQVDRHLAEHIVGIHQLRDAAVEPEFSTEQLQRYIRFARTFQPTFTEQARRVLVERYKDLRADDAQGGMGKNSYRITVRQLESMIRLSEAIAKANCVDEVTPEFVTEAYNLLRQSIISVEHDDVEMDGDDDEDGDLGGLLQPAQPQRQQQEGLDLDIAADEDGDASMRDTTRDPSIAPPARREKRKFTISHDKYASIVNAMVSRVAADESSTTTTAGGAGGGEGVDGEALVQWYLEEIEDDMDTEEEYNTEMGIARVVLKKMVKENILMAIRPGGDEASGSAQQTGGGVVYVLHPNCAVEDV